MSWAHWIEQRNGIGASVDKVSNIDFAKIAKQFGIDKKSRKREVVYVRQAFMWYLREIYGIPYQKIGDICGGYNHATVMYSVKSAFYMKAMDDKIFMPILGTVINKLSDLPRPKRNFLGEIS